MSDILACTKQFVRAPRGISFHSSQNLNIMHFAAGTNDTMFGLQVGPAKNDLLDCSGGVLPILWVDHFENCRHVNRALHRGYSPDTTKFGGPTDVILYGVKFVMSYVSYSLSFFEPDVALL